ncbi:hypothetical protein K0M31_008414 [Melipona bicolor]|uniref:Uncharacterized protein n=1 Tax=Melipona bicolor TaxID=60889 RepID=A0AA40FQY0_9HYME|nr:hypothetical protein K0M31_008414 [Melipona bicolor]
MVEYLRRATIVRASGMFSFHEGHETPLVKLGVVQAGQHQEPHVHASEAFTAIACLGVVCHDDAQREIIRAFTLVAWGLHARGRKSNRLHPNRAS